MSLWKRWFNYTAARIRSAVRAGHQDLDRREAELAAERARDPSLGSDTPTPTFDEAKERIERRTADGPQASEMAPPSDDMAFELAKQERAAQERLAKIRESLDAGDGTKPS